MSSVTDTNQFEVLASPIDDGKQQEGGLRSRFGKDDVKEQAYQAREQVKSKAVDLKEKVVNTDLASTVQSKLSGAVSTVQAQLQPTLEKLAPLTNKLAPLTDKLQPAIDLVKEKAGISKSTSNEEALEEVQEKAEGDWEEVKHKGRKQLKKASQAVDKAADAVDQKLDENLTKEQRSKLNKATLKAKKNAQHLEVEAKGRVDQLLNSVLSGPQLRPVKSFIQRNNLQLPVLILGSLLTLWMGLTVIRLITSVASPKVPEFDIHSQEASTNWLKYHAGEYKGKAIDMRDSLTARTAAFMANHEFDKMKASAIDYREIGLRKLGLSEPTWGEWAWAKLTGRPITWQERVESVISLGQRGINRKDILAKTGGMFAGIKNMLKPHEPTVGERASDMYDSLKARINPEPTLVDRLKNTVTDGIDSVRAHLPGGADAIEAARQKAYDATHQSTLDKIQSGATYLKNRVVHGAQEAAHIAQDRANEVADKAKYKAGL